MKTVYFIFKIFKILLRITMIKCKRIILSLLLRTKAARQMDLQTLWYLIHVVATHSQAGLRDLARKVALKGQTRS